MEKKANLQFLGYKISKSLIEFKGDNFEAFNIGFNPHCIINNTNNTFELTLHIKVDNTEKTFNSEITIIGNFQFTDRNDPNMESFLYLNAPAIVFPYARAYLNALTALSGNENIVLPTLNLAGLKDELKKNTTETND